VRVDPHEDLDERTLVERARADPEAFGELYRRYVARVYAFAYRRTSAPDVAEDVTAATFERALRNLESFTWRASGFGPWLFRITSNELVDHYRRTSRATSDRAMIAAHALHPDPPQDPIDQIVGRDAVAEALAALDRLSPRYQRALSLRYLSGLSVDEAAAAMGTSKATMAVIVHRAMGALRRAMKAVDQP
jgi:RNA polymerase sigma-70 factor, ECF subfamily